MGPGPSRSVLFRSTPPSTGGDTIATAVFVAGLIPFRSTPPSTGGDTSPTAGSPPPCAGFDPRRPRRAATRDLCRHGRSGDAVSIHAALDGRRHRHQEVRQGRALAVSIHAALDGRRHFRQVRVVDHVVAVSIPTPPSTGGDTSRRGRPSPRSRAFRSTPPSTGGDTRLFAHPCSVRIQFRSHAALDGRRHALRTLVATVDVMFRSTPPSTGGDT